MVEKGEERREEAGEGGREGGVSYDKGDARGACVSLERKESGDEDDNEEKAKEKGSTEKGRRKAWECISIIGA